MTNEISLNQEQQQESRSTVIRIIPYALRTPDKVLEDYQNQAGNLKPRMNLFEVYLGWRPDEHQYISPFGSKIEQLKSTNELIRAAYNIANRETVFRLVPTDLDLLAQNLRKNKLTSPFEYQIDPSIRATDNLRSVYIVPIPVINQTLLEQHIESNERLMPESLSFTLEEYKKISLGKPIETEKGSIKLEGHLRKGEVSDIRIDTKSKSEKNTKISGLLKLMNDEEKRLKVRLLSKLLVVANQSGLSIPAEITKLINSGKAHEMFYRHGDLYLKLLSDSLGENFSSLFITAYERIIAEFYLNQFRYREKQSLSKEEQTPKEKKQIRREHVFKKISSFWQKKEPLNVEQKQERRKRLSQEAKKVKFFLNGANLGLDLLHYLPLYITNPNTLGSKSTRLLNNCIRYLRDASCLALEESGFKNLFELETWFNQADIKLQDKFELIDRINKQLLDVIAESFGFDNQILERAWTQSLDFTRKFGDLIKSDPRLAILHQAHEPVNEISNSSLLQTLLYSLPSEVPTETVQLRFEAVRQLVCFLKEIFSATFYDQETAKLPNPIDYAVNDFFGPAIETRLESFTNELTGTNYLMPVQIRESKLGGRLIIDKRAIKSNLSVSRKSWEKKLADIHDMSMVNIIVPPQAHDELSAQEKIGYVNVVCNTFIDDLKKNFPDYQIELIEDEDTFENFQASELGLEIRTDGEKTGSKSDLIIRRKIMIEMKTQKDAYYYEMSFYPFYTMGKPFLGWKEKIADDATYELQRSMLPLKSRTSLIGLSSLYELWYPPLIYAPKLARVRQTGIVYQKGS